MPAVQLYDLYWHSERVGELTVTETGTHKVKGVRCVNAGQAKELRQLREVAKPGPIVLPVPVRRSPAAITGG